MDSNLISPITVKNQEALMALKSLDRFTQFFEKSHLPMMIYSTVEKNLLTNKAWKKILPCSLSVFKIEKINESAEIEAFWHEGRWLEAHVSALDRDEILITINDVSEKIETQNALIKTISDRRALFFAKKSGLINFHKSSKSFVVK